MRGQTVRTAPCWERRHAVSESRAARRAALREPSAGLQLLPPCPPGGAASPRCERRALPGRAVTLLPQRVQGREPGGTDPGFVRAAESRPASITSA